MKSSILAYLRLTRPPNLLTAVADILAGAAAALAFSYGHGELSPLFESGYLSTIGWLSLSTFGLYGGGVVFNDVFDAALDKVERPERPIPAGLASLQGASILGIGLLLMGIWAAWMVSMHSALLAIVIAAMALIYDKWGKHHNWLGPLNMGACRGLNLLLGISMIWEAVASLWMIAFVPILFIAAVTMVSRGEVHGGDRQTLWGAVGLYSGVILAILSLAYLPSFRLYISLIFILAFAAAIFPPLFKAIKEPKAGLIMKAVKAGVMSLILMDAALAAGFMGWYYGLLVVLLLPLSIGAAKIFSVT